jgi:hypothetical protein
VQGQKEQATSVLVIAPAVGPLPHSLKSFTCLIAVTLSMLRAAQKLTTSTFDCVSVLGHVGALLMMQSLADGSLPDWYGRAL